MKSASLKYKSFFYSLAIHFALGIVILALYLKEDEPHEVYSLVNLKSMHICTPEVSKPVIQEITKPKEQSKVKKKSLRPATQRKKKVSKPIEKPVIAKKTVPVLSKVVHEVVEIEEEIVEKIEEKFELKDEIHKEVVVEKEVIVEEKSPLVSVSEPKISYEAQYMKDNIALINALIKKHLSYPRLAKKRGLQGKAMVSFTLNMEGEVLDIQALGVLSSILKKSAIKTVKKASGSFPKPSQVLALRIPIVYKLH